MSASVAAASADRYRAVAGHVDQMSRMVEAIAIELGFTVWRARSLRAAAKLHDIGKVAIPDRILLKPGPLTPVEWHVMKRHTLIGFELLAHSGDGMLDLAATIALSHHERWNGAGYPQGLRGEEIPIEARIAAVADVFDALTRPRSYRPRMDADDAIDVILAESGCHFDPQVAAAFATTAVLDTGA
ncbi:MAG TPA: HD-GYP domain-containing protein [Gaiellaceae bacterium]|nr:HD-GYP domain-containing protein [Gaiellaceae bacterium]